MSHYETQCKIDGMGPTSAGKTDAVSSAVALNALAARCHEANIKWWLDLKSPCPYHLKDFHSECGICQGHGFLPLARNVGELLMLIVSELSEAMEGNRKDLMDDHLPHRKMEEVEIADAFIRLFDFCGGRGLDIGGAFEEKMRYNAQRTDHRIENRLAPGGKAY